MLNIFKKSQNKNKNAEEEGFIKITALLIHAAKIDDNYSNKERLIIINFLKSVHSEINFEEIMKKAEIEEENSNQILKYTQEIKKDTLEFKTKIVKTLWKIILSDNISDEYETSLVRRVCGLIYFPDKLSGEIKMQLINSKK